MDFFRHYLPVYGWGSSTYSHGFVAQWLEHWSCKPGVESSNLSEAFCLDGQIRQPFELACQGRIGFVLFRLSNCIRNRLKTAPNVGLEPTTLRLRVSCSTD